MAIVFFQRLEVALDSIDVRLSDEQLLLDLELCSLLGGPKGRVTSRFPVLNHPILAMFGHNGTSFRLNDF